MILKSGVLLSLVMLWSMFYEQVPILFLSCTYTVGRTCMSMQRLDTYSISRRLVVQIDSWLR